MAENFFHREKSGIDIILMDQKEKKKKKKTFFLSKKSYIIWSVN